MNAQQLAELVCPDLKHPQVRYKDLLRQLLQPGIRWLDLGCGREVVRPWALLPGEDGLSFTRAPSLSVGIDGDIPALRANRSIQRRVAGNLEFLPFQDQSFDVVTANMVLEHAEKPRALLSEVWRVLRPRGVFVVHTPNRYYPPSLLAWALPYQIKSRLVAVMTHRQRDDVYPTFFRFNTRSAIFRYSEAAGFRIRYSQLLDTLTFDSRRLLFVCCLAFAWLSRRSGLKSLKADHLVMLCKPDSACCGRCLRPFA